MKYLKDNHVSEELNLIINKLCKDMTEDPYGYLARECQARAKAPFVTRLVGREVLDSRGNPTVETDVYANVLGKEKLVARSGAPSGASTGSNEAHELRDGDKSRYLGKGTATAASNVGSQLSAAVKGKDFANFRALDEALCKADGTELKTVLGGNAITASSFALAEAGAALTDTPLFLYLSAAYHGANKPAKYTLPRPLVNILNGGKHAGGELKVQEFMIVPSAARSFKENLRVVTEVYHHLGKILAKEKGLSAKNLGDEGGYAPDLRDPNEALGYIEKAIQVAGYRLGDDVGLALDCASSEFYDRDSAKYEIEKGKFLTTHELIQYYLKLKRDHPALISIEDPLDEKDYEGWTAMTAAFAAEFPGTMIIGDDLYTTNTNLIKRGVAAKWANALLLKVNQIGTISESMDAAKMIFEDKGNVIVSHRSGETTNAVISDLAVAIGAGFIKTGATARGERTCKYNRLLQIEEYLVEHKLI